MTGFDRALCYGAMGVIAAAAILLGLLMPELLAMLRGKRRRK